MKIVLDTNVLVSGMLNPGGTPGRILDLVSTAHVTVLFDDRILAEYRDVLARPKLRLPATFAALIIEGIERNGVLVPAPPLDIALPDPQDVPFVEVAEAGGAAAIVTGNGRHFLPITGALSVEVLTPAEFFVLWQQGRRYPPFD